jgi:hypothetical protein
MKPPARLILKGDHDNILTLAPLERTGLMDSATLQEFDFRLLKQRNLVRCLVAEPAGKLEDTFVYLPGAAVWFAF